MKYYTVIIQQFSKLTSYTLILVITMNCSLILYLYLKYLQYPPCRSHQAFHCKKDVSWESNNCNSNSRGSNSNSNSDSTETQREQFQFQFHENPEGAIPIPIPEGAIPIPIPGGAIPIPIPIPDVMIQLISFIVKIVPNVTF